MSTHTRMHTYHHAYMYNCLKLNSRHIVQLIHTVVLALISHFVERLLMFYGNFCICHLKKNNNLLYTAALTLQDNIQFSVEIPGDHSKQVVLYTLHWIQMANVSNGRQAFKVYDQPFRPRLKCPT